MNTGVLSTLPWPALLSLSAVTIAAGGCISRFILWRRAKRTPIRAFHSLARIPNRYLVDVHEVVARDPTSARMHICSAGGYVATLVSATLVFSAPKSTAYAALLLASTMLTLVGAMLDQRRRISSTRRPGLSKGMYELVPTALACFAIFYGVTALPTLGLLAPIVWLSRSGLVLLSIGLFGTIFVVVGLARGPMRHAFAGAMHLAFHPRSDRFTRSGPSTALRAVDLNGEPIGVGNPRDFLWNQVLSFDACVQCGRCEVVCPAFEAGLPLNPKKLIFDLWKATCGSGSDVSYAGNPHPGHEDRVSECSRTGRLVDEISIVHPDTIWACTTCRACVDACPMLIEHVDAIVDLRRFLTLEIGATPKRGPNLLANLMDTDNCSGKAPSRRIDWATDLALPIAASIGRPFDILLWLGEGAFDIRAQRTLRALIKLLRLARVDFAVLGEEEADSGELARRLGDEATFEGLARRNISTLARYQFTQILTADPHVLHVLKQEYPALGGHYVVLHHTTFLSQLLQERRLAKGVMQDLSVTFHDPCYLGRYNGEFESPRQVLASVGIRVIEMERSKRRSFCCGGGGGAPTTDVGGKRRIPDIRLEQARATGADILAVACPNCAVMFEGVPGPRPTVVDVAELLAQSLDSEPEPVMAKEHERR